MRGSPSGKVSRGHVLVCGSLNPRRARTLEGEGLELGAWGHPRDIKRDQYVQSLTRRNVSDGGRWAYLLVSLLVFLAVLWLFCLELFNTSAGHDMTDNCCVETDPGLDLGLSVSVSSGTPEGPWLAVSQVATPASSTCLVKTTPTLNLPRQP